LVKNRNPVPRVIIHGNPRRQTESVAQRWHRCKYPPAEPEALGFEPLKAASLLGLARSNDCAQHSHLSAANRAIFIASMHLCHSPTFKNRKPWHTPGNVKHLRPPGGAGGSPIWFSASNDSGCITIKLQRASLDSCHARPLPLDLVILIASGTMHRRALRLIELPYNVAPRLLQMQTPN
jgi:hypothetical protein